MFSTQKIVNNYPKNLRLREDPSSLGFRFFSLHGDFLQLFFKDLRRLQQNFFPVTSSTDVANISYLWDIGTFEFEFEDPLTMNYLKYPTVNGDSFSLTVSKTLEEFLFLPPTRISYVEEYNFDGIVYESTLTESSTINDIVIPGRLYIEINGATRFYQTSVNNAKSPPKRATLILVGEDAYGNELNEHITLNYNGIYVTKDIYYKLISIVLSNIETDGGSIIIKSLDLDISSIPSKYEIGILSDKAVELKKEFDENFFYIKYPVFDIQASQRLTEDKETFCAFALRDEDDNIISIDDISFIYDLETLAALSGNKVYIYDSWLPPVFQAPISERTSEIVIGAELTTPYPTLNEDFIFYIYNRSIYRRSKQITIKIIDPDNEEFYINGDLELSETEFTFLGDPTTDWPGDTFADKKVTMVPDKTGQWELVITTVDIDENEYIDVINFIVPSLTASKTLTLDEDYDSISFSCDGFLYALTGENLHKYRLYYDYCIIDIKSKTLFSRENYDDLEVIYE